MSEVPLYLDVGVILHHGLELRPSAEHTRFISHRVFSESFCKSQFPHKSIKLFFVLVIIKDKLTNL